MADDPHIVMRCPRCGSDAIEIPNLQAPRDYAFDAALVLVRCKTCGARPKMTDATVIDDDAESPGT